jgi:hypothetical protein
MLVKYWLNGLPSLRHLPNAVTLNPNYPKVSQIEGERMAWRVHLTNQAIQHLDILPSKPTLLIAWTQRDRATYFELESGIELGEHTHKAVSRQSDKWGEFAASLVAPNGAYLPYIRTAQATIYTTEDGRMRLFHSGDTDLTLEVEGQNLPLEVKGANRFRALAFDRFLGVLTALDEKGRLHLYQQHIRAGAFDLKMKPDSEFVPGLAISEGGAAIFVSNGQEIVLTDTSGQVKKRQSVHYFIGRIACSPDGKLLVASDSETGVIRVYEGADLTPSYQRHAIDLLHKADQLQLIADFPPANAAPGTLVIGSNGALAFTISGVVCATSLKQMDALPRPQPLL